MSEEALETWLGEVGTRCLSSDVTPDIRGEETLELVPASSLKWPGDH